MKCFILESIFNPMLPFAIVWALFDSMFIGLFMAGIKSGGITGKFSLDFTIIPFLGFFALHLMPVLQV